MKNEDDLEEWLARRRPAEPPEDLMRGLLAAEPLPAQTKRLWQQTVGWLSLGGGLLRPWPLAYAGLAAAWMMILALRLLTLPLLPESSDRFPAAQTSVETNNSPGFAGNAPAERTFLFARNHYSEELWP